ncbi:MAG: hypothetical protein N2512_08345 [Armatimonadetes bacterium]|nr:hypothetical protein [Armatimonadota bacterium]
MGRLSAPVVFLDLDDCAAGAIWPSLDRPRQPFDRAVLGELLSEFASSGASVHFLTNRPSGQLAIVAHMLGGPARYHLAESGLAAWLPDENRAAVHPDYCEFVRDILPEVLGRLRGHFSLGWDAPLIEEFGTRLATVTVFPRGSGEAEVQALCDRCRELLADLPVEVRQGKGVDIGPAGVSKVLGCRWAEELHPQLQGGLLDWTQVLYVEDSLTGLEAARYISRNGGMIAAVANADPEFRRAVQELGGLLCCRSYEHGVLEAVRAWLGKTT